MQIIFAEIGLILILFGLLYPLPLVIKEIATNDNIVAFVFILSALALAIIAGFVRLYKIFTSSVKLDTNLDAAFTELTVIKLTKNHPTFLVSVLFSTILPLLFIIFLITIPQSIQFLLSFFSFFNPEIAMLFFIFSVIFIVIFLQTLGLLIAGEILQKHFSQVQHNFILHMSKNVLFALPYVVFYSLVFFFVLLARSERDKDESALVSSAKDLSILAGLQTLKYYIYANLSSVAFEDRYTYATLNDSAQYLKDNSRRLISVFASSAALTGVASIYLIAMWAWAGKVSFLSTDTAFSVSFSLGGVLFLWMVYVEQVIFLLNYIKIRHPYYDVDTFAGIASIGPDVTGVVSR